MKEFSLELPTKLYYGTHIVEDALRKESFRFTGNILVVTSGRTLVKNGYVSQLMEYLEALPDTKKIVIYDKVSQNPKLDEVKEAIAIGKKENVQLVVGFGGGSALDAAKATAVGITSEENIEVYLLEGKEPTEKTLPIVAIPTTAGTGSELSKGAIISSPRHKLKAGIRGKNIIPALAIVDCVYTWTVPWRITMETGFDALSHAIESYVAVKANPFSEMLSEKTIRIIGENLTLLNENLENHAAREKMCFASMIIGINLANVGTCLPHRMQYVIGANTATSHGAGLLALYPSWFQHEYEVNQDKVNHIIEWMGYPAADTPEKAGQIFIHFLQKLGINYSLSDWGITEQAAEEFSSKVTGNLANDRLSEKEEILKMIFMESL